MIEEIIISDVDGGGASEWWRPSWARAGARVQGAHELRSSGHCTAATIAPARRRWLLLRRRLLLLLLRGVLLLLWAARRSERTRDR